MEELSALTASEVLEVLNNTDISLVSKIPYKVLNFLQIKSNEYEGKVEFSEGTLSEQSISEDAKAVLAVIYTDYFCDDEKKIQIKDIFDENQKRFDKEEAEKFSVFKNEKIIKSEENIQKKEEALIEVTSKEKWYQKFLSKIKSIFK